MCRTWRAAWASTTASGASYLHAGPGYGGSPASRRTRWRLIKTAQDYGTPSRIVEAVASVNDLRKRAMAKKVVAACGGSVRGARPSPCWPDLQAEHRRHARCAFAVDRHRAAGWRRHDPRLDPEGMEQAKGMLPGGVVYCNDAYLRRGCACGRDRHRVEHLPRAGFPAAQGTMAAPVLIDLRNVYRAEQVRGQGFHLCRCRAWCPRARGKEEI